MWEGKKRKMCQFSLGDTKITIEAEVQSLGLAEYRTESEKQCGCVGILEVEGETVLMSWAQKWGCWRGAVRLTEEMKGGVWQGEPAKSWLVCEEG